jgi:hypothetical protein
MDLLDFVTRQGGRATVRDVQRSNRKLYATAGSAKQALAELVSARHGYWEVRPAPARGGNTSLVFVLGKGQSDSRTGDSRQ